MKWNWKHNTFSLTILTWKNCPLLISVQEFIEIGAWLLLSFSLRLHNQLQAFFISNTFITNARLKLEKNRGKAKQHPKADLLLFENFSFSSSMLSSKNNRRYPKKCTKNKCICFDEVI